MKRTTVICLMAGILSVASMFAGPAIVQAEEEVDAKLTQAITKLNAEQKAALLVLVSSIVDAQESPEEGAMKTVKAYIEAAESADLERLMEQISEDFSHYEVGNKAGYHSFLERVKNEGMLEDITGNSDNAKAEVKGEIVTVNPVELEGIFGTVIMEFELKQEDGTWKIVGMEMTGV